MCAPLKSQSQSFILHTDLNYGPQKKLTLLVPEDEKIGRNCCWVEFDDGDSGEFPLPDVRMIPPDFPSESTGKITMEEILELKCDNTLAPL